MFVGRSSIKFNVLFAELKCYAFPVCSMLPFRNELKLTAKSAIFNSVSIFMARADVLRSYGIMAQHFIFTPGSSAEVSRIIYWYCIKTRILFAADICILCTVNKIEQ